MQGSYQKSAQTRSKKSVLKTIKKEGREEREGKENRV
jgi:hypothetical protein